ncbi:MAG: DUF5908 family protein [Lewinella sp.]|uniref:DUF5908 family protein n=1 Tax=Lewinella sp. TaxID=2004506 RepID=UPI003D6B076B
MPLEIREVIIKAQLERSWTEQSGQEPFNPQDLENLKEEILAFCLEKIEEQRVIREQTDRPWL